MTGYELLVALIKGPHEGAPMDWLEKEVCTDEEDHPIVIEVDEKGSCIVIRTRAYDPSKVR